MADTLRVLTVRQPWATAIVRMGKDVENRTQNIAGGYRGPVAIHAATHEPGRIGQRTTFGGDLEVERDRGGLLLRSPHLAWPYRLPLGVVIGVVDLIDVHEWSDDGVCYGHEGADGEATCSPWGMADHHHLALANPRPLDRTIPATGRLGLWRPDAALEDAIWQQVAA
jgi:hypothetical protein